jgi:hypothetical protein
MTKQKQRKQKRRNKVITVQRPTETTVCSCGWKGSDAALIRLVREQDPRPGAATPAGQHEDDPRSSGVCPHCAGLGRLTECVVEEVEATEPLYHVQAKAISKDTIDGKTVFHFWPKINCFPPSRAIDYDPEVSSDPFAVADARARRDECLRSRHLKPLIAWMLTRGFFDISIKVEVGPWSETGNYDGGCIDVLEYGEFHIAEEVPGVGLTTFYGSPDEQVVIPGDFFADKAGKFPTTAWCRVCGWKGEQNQIGYSIPHKFQWDNKRLVRACCPKCGADNAVSVGNAAG